MRKTSSHTIPETAPKAALIMLLSGLFVLFISALFILRAESPAALARPLSLVSLYLGAMAGGFYAAKLIPDGQAYIASAAAAALLVALMVALKFILPDDGDALAPMLSLGLHGAVIGAAAFGTLAGLKQPARRRKRKKHSRS